MTSQPVHANALSGLREKLRLFQYFFSSLRKRGLWRTFKISLFEVYYEYRLGARTSYVIPRQQLDGDEHAMAHATDYFPSSYLVLREAFSCVQTECRDAVLIDYGCGMGRALMVASKLPLKRIIGVELSQSLCVAAMENLERLYRKTGQINPSWSVVNCEASAFAIPEDANLIYLFNPFDAEILGRVVDNIMESLRNAPRKCTVIYANPVHESEFLSRAFGRRPTGSKDFSVFTLDTHHRAFPL
jgi:predicted RNA methylase